MKKKIYLIFLLLVTIIQANQNLLLAENYIELDRVVAIVEKEVITEVELKNSINQVLAKSKQDNDADQYKGLLRSEVLDELIQKSLIEQYARQGGIKIDQKKIDAFIENISKKNNMSVEELKNNIEDSGVKFGKFIDNIRYELILKQIKRKEISSKINVSEFEIKAQLDKNAVLNPDIYNISHILIQTSSEATPDEIEKNYKKSIKVHQLILSGKKFEEVAKKYSND